MRFKCDLRHYPPLNNINLINDKITMFKQGNTFGKGRGKGTKNKMVNREGAVQLMDKIIEDLNANYYLLSIDEKLRILSSFKQLYNFEYINEMDEVHEIKIHIIPPLVTN
jgi:hypothetical protein